MHDITSDIIDWDQANQAYLAGGGQSGEVHPAARADRMAEIEVRWHRLPGEFRRELTLDPPLWTLAFQPL
jgi:hypothetical protein